MDKFIPTDEQKAQAANIAKKNKVDTVFVNEKGEHFLEEQWASNSVAGDKKRYCRLHIAEEGVAKPVTNAKRRVTVQDLKDNPLLKASGLKPGDEIELPVTEEIEEEEESGDTSELSDKDTLKEGLQTIDKPIVIKSMITIEENRDNRPEVLEALKARLEELEPVEDTGEEPQGPTVKTDIDPTQLSIADLKKELKNVTDREVLGELVKLETAGENRKGALEAISERTKEL